MSAPRGGQTVRADLFDRAMDRVVAAEMELADLRHQLRGAVQALTQLVDAAETFIHDGTTTREYTRFLAAMNDARPYTTRGQ